jgi:ribosomal protein S18 acetylase RimI-like enzyme
MHEDVHQTEINYGLFGKEHINRMTEIRHICFPDSNITKFGVHAQHRFCAWLIDGPHDVIALGAFVDGQLAGFLVAGKFRGVVSGFIKNNKFFLMRRFLLNPKLLLDRAIQLKTKHMLVLFSNPFRNVHRKNVAEISLENSCAMLDLAVHPNFRTLGLGASLMSKGEEIAVQRGYERAHCSVQKNNSKVIKFHERHGYRIVQDKSDSVFMIKNLNPA